MWQDKDNAGDWRGLDSAVQVPRYTAIAEILRDFHVDKNVLDVGCGEALLRAYLPKDANYMGIEQSALAAGSALQRDASIKVIHTSAEEFEPRDERFDSIVFNEMLYYTENPVGLLRKYMKFLHREGVILCSIYQKQGGVSFMQRMRYLVNHRFPLSAVNCEKKVRTFMQRERWPILTNRIVSVPGCAAPWHIWLARPIERSVSGKFDGI
jgi:SAM-dependent methyltransferase